MRKYVWAVEITAMPEGSVTEDGSFTPGWEPENWPEERAALKRANLMRPEETEFFWPVMDKVYMSRSTAKKRADLLERYGATAHVVRSRLVWEDPRADHEAGSLGAAIKEQQNRLDDLVSLIGRRRDAILFGGDAA